MAQNGTIYIQNQEKPASDGEKQKVRDKLNRLVKGTQRVIYEVKATFPFQLFPDRLIIDENKVTIVRKNLFFKRVFPITYDNLVTVKVNRNIIFASIEFEVVRFAEPPTTMTYLKPAEADKAKRYITGLLEATKEGIDLTKLDINEVRRKLEQIGSPEDEATRLF